MTIENEDGGGECIDREKVEGEGEDGHGNDVTNRGNADISDSSVTSLPNISNGISPEPTTNITMIAAAELEGKGDAAVSVPAQVLLIIVIIIIIITVISEPPRAAFNESDPCKCLFTSVLLSHH